MRLSGKVAINVSALTAGRLLNAAMGVVGVAIAARYLGVESYGALIVGIAFTGTISVLTDLGTATIGAREIAKRPQEARRLLRAVFTVNVILCAFTVVVALAAMFALYSGPEHHLEREAIILLLVPTVILPAASTVGVWFIVEQKNYLGMVASVFGSLALLAIVVLTDKFDWGFTGIAAAYAANGAAFSLGMIFLGMRNRVPLRPSVDRAQVTQILRWALPLGGSFVISALYTRLDVILLSVLSDDTEVGPYGLAFKVVDVLVSLPVFMMLTLLPEFARLSEHRERLEELMQKAFSVMQTGAVPLLVFMVVFAEQVVTTVGGNRFEGAVPILQVLMFGVVIGYLAAVCAQGLIALNRQRILFRLSVWGLVLNALLNAALIPLGGGLGAAVAYVGTELAVIGLLSWQFTRVAQFPRPENVARFVVAAGLMASVGLIKLVPWVDDLPSIVLLAIGGALSGAVYLGALYALGAVPSVVHDSLMLPLWRRLRARAVSGPS